VQIIAFFFINQIIGFSFYTLAATLKLNFRVQREKMMRKALSINDLKKLVEDSRTKLPNKTRKIRRLLLMIQYEAVFKMISIVLPLRYGHLVFYTIFDTTC
jgi:hypothetical protein